MPAVCSLAADRYPTPHTSSTATRARASRRCDSLSSTTTPEPGLAGLATWLANLASRLANLASVLVGVTPTHTGMPVRCHTAPRTSPA